MLRTMIEKELKAILVSPKFAATFLVCSVLIIASVLIGIREYQTARKSYETATRLVNEEMRGRSNWMGLTSRIYREPEPMQIFISGVTNDLGRWSPLGAMDAVKLRSSVYSDDPIFALFRFIDLSFIVQIILSLFALLFTYDAVNGEREGGTLQLAFANAVPRASFILAKGIGAWLGLVLPLTLPAAIGVLLVLLYGVPMTATHWMSLGLFGLASLLMFTFFIGLGVLLSAAIKRSSISFLSALVCWVALVLILPRIGVIAAGQMVPVPSAAEVDAQMDGYAKDRWEQWKKETNDRWDKRNESQQAMSKEEAEAFREANMWSWMEEDDALRKQVELDIDANRLRVQEEIRNRRATQEKLAFMLARFSPVSAYQLAVMDLGGTDIGLKTRYEDALNAFRPSFTSYIDQKQKESGGGGGLRITVDSEKGFKFEMPRETGALDISGVPQFAGPVRSFSEIARTAVLDMGLLGIFTLIAAAGAFVIFLRLDLR